MRSLINTPLESTLARWWNGIDASCRKAFFIALCVSVLAFGFEMTNLTLHHDDLNHIMIQDTILGHYLGRFGHGWFHYVLQNHYVMPFLQLAQGMLATSAYGVLVSHFWGARKTLELVLLAAIICTFPYMAHIYQYNTTQPAYPTAYLLAALAAIQSVRASYLRSAIAAVLYFAAFSIYQAVAANAATILVIWLLSRHLFGGEAEALTSRETAKAIFAALASVLAGGILYLAAVWSMHLEPDTIHSSEEAFQLRGLLNPAVGLQEIFAGTRAFLRWPENYFPEYLKALQLAILTLAVVYCVQLPKSIPGKIAAVALLVLAAFTPRTLQLLAPKGHFHTLTLTGYAILIAGSLMISLRAARTSIRNLSIVLSTILIAGYVLQCNWISTVNYLNTRAHFDTVTQILARVRSVPDASWNGKVIAVVGTYDMPSDYPFKPATGVATEFMDARHMTIMARLMRDEAVFVAADQTMPKVLAYAASHPVWPAPSSVGVVDGMGVVVLSSTSSSPLPEQ